MWIEGSAIKTVWRGAGIAEVNSALASSGSWTNQCFFNWGPEILDGSIIHGGTIETRRLDAHTYISNNHIEICQFHKHGANSAPEEIGIWRRYDDLEQGLTELKEDEDLQINSGVYNRAVQVAAMVASKMFPSPEIFTHSPTSVVFSWKSEDDKLFMTIGEQQIAILIIGSEGGTRRAEIASSNLNVAGYLFTALQPIALRQLAIDTARSEESAEMNV